VSLTYDNQEGNGQCYSPVISADGHYVAFSSVANNMVPGGDTNGKVDIFVRGLQTGETSRVSLSSDNDPANDESHFPSISGDGRYVAFDSLASNLVDDDNNGTMDVFVRDLQLGETTRVSLSSDNIEGDGQSWCPSISADGRYVAFFSGAANLVADDTNLVADVFVRDRLENKTTRVSLAWNGDEGNSFSAYPSISADGRYVAFDSEATNLVNGDTNDDHDIFVRDRQLNTTTRVSVSSSGTEGEYDSQWPRISADGGTCPSNPDPLIWWQMITTGSRMSSSITGIRRKPLR